MAEILINKKSKRINVKLAFLDNNGKSRLNILTEGPLGKISCDISNFTTLSGNKFFIKKNDLNFLVKKINKLIKSVSSGWFVELNLNGLGYKSFKLNNKIALDLGYSNLIIYKPTDKIKIRNFKNKIVLFSLDQEYLYQVVSNLKSYSTPDSYKGKGILRKGEIVKLKKKSKS